MEQSILTTSLPFRTFVVIKVVALIEVLQRIGPVAQMNVRRPLIIVFARRLRLLRISIRATR